MDRLRPKAGLVIHSHHKRLIFLAEYCILLLH